MEKGNFEQLALWGNIPKWTKDKSYYSKVQEEIAVYGLGSAGIKELLALIIGKNADTRLCQEIALLSPSRLLALSAAELQTYGFTPNVAIRIEAALRLSTKLQTAETKKELINSPEDAARILSFIANEEQENMVVILLDTRNNVKKTIVVSRGTLNSSLVHPREVFKIAIRENVHSIIVGHNHPSADTTPSREDIEITKRIADASKIIGIQLLDHVIVGGNGYSSLKEMGVL